MADEPSKPAKTNDPSSHQVATSKEVTQLYANFDYKAHAISFERFIEMTSDPKIVILDLRNEAAFKRGHIKGAHYLGADVTKEKLAKLVPSPKTTILIYCDISLGKPTRRLALTYTLAPQIYALGYRNVYFPILPSFDPLEKLPWEGKR